MDVGFVICRPPSNRKSWRSSVRPVVGRRRAEDAEDGEP